MKKTTKQTMNHQTPAPRLSIQRYSNEWRSIKFVQEEKDNSCSAQ